MKQSLRIGDIIYGTVSGVQKYGIFIDLAQHQQGLIHISEIQSGYVKDLKRLFKVGERVRVMVIDINEYNQKISLSLRVLNQNRNQRSISINYRSNKKHFYTNHHLDLGFAPLAKALPQWVDEAEKFMHEKR